MAYFNGLLGRYGRGIVIRRAGAPGHTGEIGFDEGRPKAPKGHGLILLHKVAMGLPEPSQSSDLSHKGHTLPEATLPGIIRHRVGIEGFEEA